MNSEETCNLSIRKGDTEYLHSFLESIPDNFRNKAKHMRLVRAVVTELQRHQIEWKEKSFKEEN